MERRSLVECPDLLFQERQEVGRVEDHVDLLVGPRVPGGDLAPGADHNFADIPSDLDFVMGILAAFLKKMLAILREMKR